MTKKQDQKRMWKEIYGDKDVLPRPKDAEIIQAAKDVITAWETLPGGRHYSPKEIDDWLRHDMAPAIGELREKLKP